MRHWIYAVALLSGCSSRAPAPQVEPARDATARAALDVPAIAGGEALRPPGATWPSLVVRVAADGETSVLATPGDLVALGTATGTRVELARLKVVVDGVEAGMPLGTALALDPQPPLTREAAIEAARTAGVLGQTYASPSPAFASLEPEPAPRSLWDAVHLAVAVATPDADGPALLVASAGADAGQLVDVVARTRGPIAVVHGGVVAMLRLGLATAPPAEPGPWLEVSVAPDGIMIQAVPGAQQRIDWRADGGLDEPVLRGAAIALRPTAAGRVDVLVAPGVTVQQLIDVMVALERSGAPSIAIGRVPFANSLQRQVRAVPLPAIGLSSVAMHGKLARDAIALTLFDARDRLATCRGASAAVEFYVVPTGEVLAAKGQGASGACLAGIIKTLRFPASSEGTQVVARFEPAP